MTPALPSDPPAVATPHPAPMHPRPDQHDADGAAQVARAVRDPERLREIASLGLLDGHCDDVLEATAREAAAELGLPIGLVTLVLDEAQHFAAAHGLGGWMAEARGTPVEWAFCRFAVARRGAFVVEDAASHPLVAANPLVTVDGVRCYAGHPLVTAGGHVLGTLCVLGPEPRSFTDAELARLREHAARAVARIEARRTPR
jgi:GAF domain-containing protein